MQINSSTACAERNLNVAPVPNFPRRAAARTSIRVVEISNCASL
jgi:hypothetical protein